ncbi:protein dj-1beta [Galendromus occidentalis]|uniref:Protein dj-1beta n=1 Tax=Galendromus occidentalis TaxID=34638 RepID=A0AAJ6QRP5_9ACAR|nr:protein dj-1beta [Galendromus occidentalis]
MYLLRAISGIRRNDLCVRLLKSRSFCCTAKMSAQNACVLLAHGSEEMEAVIVIDVLRRAGLKVTVAGVDGTELKCSRDIVIKADKSLEDARKEKFDVVVLPGGLKGSETFCANAKVGEMLKEQESSGRTIGAICAAPMALAAHNIGKGKNVTIYPSMESKMEGYTCKEDRVVVDGKLITSRGPGTAFDFACTLVRELLGAEKAQETAKPMLYEFK